MKRLNINNEKVVCFTQGKWKEAKYKVGDFVVHEGIEGVITRIIVYPDVNYVFAYNMFPTHRGSDIPEDEIEESL